MPTPLQCLRRPFSRLALSRLACLASAALLAACASSESARQANDPLEPLNRAVFGFNTALDDAVLEPVAAAYTTVTPRPARDGVRNFMDNLNQPVVFANALLQAKPRASVETFGRFTVNTIFGIGGLFDVASAAGIARHNEDFGQTLAVWGVGEGVYLMLPVLGPSNLRDGTGRFVDRYPHPLNWNEEYGQSAEAWTLRGVNGVDPYARNQDALSRLEAAAIDPYVQIRSAYRQMREREIANGEDAEFDDLPDFDD